MTLSGLWYPGKPEEREPAFVCRIPCGPEGETCGHIVYQDENAPERARTAHLRQCVRDNEEWIRSQSPRARMPLFHDHPDPEVRDHMKRVGDRMKREGRLVVHPSERAGFS